MEYNEYGHHVGCRDGSHLIGCGKKEVLKSRVLKFTISCTYLYLYHIDIYSKHVIHGYSI